MKYKIVDDLINYGVAWLIIKNNSHGYRHKRFCSVKAGEKFIRKLKNEFIRKLKNEYKEHVTFVFKVVPAGD
jgi:hypothetical protein